MPVLVWLYDILLVWLLVPLFKEALSIGLFT